MNKKTFVCVGNVNIFTVNFNRQDFSSHLLTDSVEAHSECHIFDIWHHTVPNEFDFEEQFAQIFRRTRFEQRECDEDEN